jgi:flagellar hook-length control protein FliK
MNLRIAAFPAPLGDKPPPASGRTPERGQAPFAETFARSEAGKGQARPEKAETGRTSNDTEKDDAETGVAAAQLGTEASVPATRSPVEQAPLPTGVVRVLHRQAGISTDVPGRTGFAGQNADGPPETQVEVAPPKAGTQVRAERAGRQALRPASSVADLQATVAPDPATPTRPPGKTTTPPQPPMQPTPAAADPLPTQAHAEAEPPSRLMPTSGTATSQPVPTSLPSASLPIPSEKVTEASVAAQNGTEPQQKGSQVNQDRAPPVGATMATKAGTPLSPTQDRLAKVGDPKEKNAEGEAPDSADAPKGPETPGQSAPAIALSAAAHREPVVGPVETRLPSSELPSDTLVAEVAGVDTLRADRAQAPSQNIDPALLSRPDTARSVAAQIADVVRAGREGTVEVTLRPEELGRVSLSFSNDGGALTVSLTADRPETLELLRRNIALLEQDLRQLGYASLDFAFNDGAGGEGHGPGRDHAGRPTADDTGLMDTGPVRPEARGLTPSGGMDLRL